MNMEWIIERSKTFSTTSAGADPVLEVGEGPVDVQYFCSLCTKRFKDPVQKEQGSIQKILLCHLNKW